jgi:hypothetical protein
VKYILTRTTFLNQEAYQCEKVSFVYRILQLALIINNHYFIRKLIHILDKKYVYKLFTDNLTEQDLNYIVQNSMDIDRIVGEICEIEYYDEIFIKNCHLMLEHISTINKYFESWIKIG